MPEVATYGATPCVGPRSGTGAADDEAVLPASVTVTFGAPKIGLALGRGPELAGRIVLVDLGLDLDRATSRGRVAVELHRPQRA